MDKRVISFRGSTRQSSPRMIRNLRLAQEYRDKGYKVIANNYPNNAFAAIYQGTNPHTEYEITVAKIFAENGISITLEKDGINIRLTDGTMLQMPSPDGLLDNTFSHEIMALSGKPDVSKVADGIKHSFKVWKKDRAKFVQADVAITFTPKGSEYHRKDIDAGVKEYKRQVKEGETKAKPLIYLHVDEGHREIYYRNIK